MIPDGNFSLTKVELLPTSQKPLRRLAAVYVLDGKIFLGDTELAVGDFALVTMGESILGNPTETPSRCVILEA